MKEEPIIKNWKACSSGPRRDPECSSRTAPRQEVSENLEEAKSPRRVYSESVRSRDSDATRESKEFFAFLNSYEGKLWVGSLRSDLFSSRLFPNDSRVSSTHEGRLSVRKKGGGE